MAYILLHRQQTLFSTTTTTHHLFYLSPMPATTRKLHIDQSSPPKSAEAEKKALGKVKETNKVKAKEKAKEKGKQREVIDANAVDDNAELRACLKQAESK